MKENIHSVIVQKYQNLKLKFSYITFLINNLSKLLKFQKQIQKITCLKKGIETLANVDANKVLSFSLYLK